ncbi:MAG: leucyl/phenylalanyl-tRNA--protein transferase [Woeseiaceae bacterium]|jgi:leucyl/phenylalanyl-tRNA--protein transferase|nr:leucyl/phenylalanyl-tRNA--protein transferase [Woeseiaceae bacterium]
MSNGHVIRLSQDDPPETFPSVSATLTGPEGLIAVGGDLSSERLLFAYQNGIFPWYNKDQPILWWSPNPRCVFLPGDFHISRRLQRELRCSSAELRVNTAFSKVIRECASPRRSEKGTWITSDMIKAYEKLYRQGWAHSIEIWESNKLIGGLYGLAIGQIFFGESMFSRVSNASKIALLFIANHLESSALKLLDCQVVSTHLETLGARIISRSNFIERLSDVSLPSNQFHNWQTEVLPCSKLFNN